MVEALPPRRGRIWARGIRQAVLLAALMGLSLSGYLLVLKWRGPAAVLVTQTAWDRSIPFRPAWVWAYLIPYVVGPVVAGLLCPETFAWYVRRALLLVAVSLVIFALWPTQTVRATAPDLGDGLTAHLYRQMVAIDEPPANAAPSLHVSLTCLLAWAAVRDWPRYWPAAFGCAGVVWLATLLTWQHHLLDVATGVALGSVAAVPQPGRRAAGLADTLPPAAG
jgi:hypothetical protein